MHERLRRVVETAVLAERLGFDSYAIGERHAGEARLVTTSRAPMSGRDPVQRFAEEVIPLVRREAHTTLWGPRDKARARGFTAAADGHHAQPISRPESPIPRRQR